MISDNDLEELLFASADEQRKTSSAMSFVPKLVWVIASVPVLATVSLLLMALRVRIGQGWWPTHNNPDPKDLGFHNLVTSLLILGSFVVVVLLPLLALAIHFGARKPVSIRSLIVGAVGTLILFLILRLDPGGLGTWIVD